jgi:hypothetical protein
LLKNNFKKSGGAITKQGLMIHELVEQKLIGWDNKNQDEAHFAAMVVENQVNGSLRMPFYEPTSKFSIKQGMFPTMTGQVDTKYIMNGNEYIYRADIKENDIIDIRRVDTVIPKETKKN